MADEKKDPAPGAGGTVAKVDGVKEVRVVVADAASAATTKVYDETVPGGRFIVDGRAQDAHGNEHKDKATPEEVEASFRQRGLTPPPQAAP